MSRRIPPRFTPSRAGAITALTHGRPSGELSALEVIDAELVEESSPALDGDVIEKLLNSFITETGRLVPASSMTMDVATITDPAQRRRVERAQLIDEMRAGAMADSTLATYGGHVRAWMAWCRDEGVPALPFDPRLVANCLLDYALVWDFDADDFQRDDEGELVPAVAMGTVDTRLKALNKAAEFVGLPRPGDNPGVKEVMAGLRRRFGTASVGKEALDLAGINKCLAAAGGLTYTDTRDRVAVLLRAHTGATAGQLAKLHWSDLDIDDTSVRVTLGKTCRYGESTSVTVAAHSNPDLCLVRALGHLLRLAPKMRHVLTHRDGKPMTRQAMHNLLGEHWETLPQLRDKELARFLASEFPVVASFSTTRDRALLLVAFYTALRRSNLSALNWRDITDHGDDGLAVLVRRSKTDQEGRGRTVWVPQASPDSPLACPAETLRSWRAELERALGRPLDERDPVFVSLTSSGAPKVSTTGRAKRLSGDGINEVVQRLVVAAGIIAKPCKGERNPYGAHSTRAGFVTEATRDDKLSIVEVMEVTGHASVEMVARYRREANAPKRNASRKLMNILSV